MPDSGYTPKRRTFRLIFEDEEFAGLVVRAKSVPIGGLLDALGLAALGDVLDHPEKMRPEDLAKLEALFETFADALLEWNVRDERGRKVPATLAGVRSQDTDFILSVIKAWYQGVVGVSAPLGARSSNGPPSEPPRLPMESLGSESRKS
jgi:hypothetical protein